MSTELVEHLRVAGVVPVNRVSVEPGALGFDGDMDASGARRGRTDLVKLVQTL